MLSHNVMYITILWLNKNIVANNVPKIVLGSWSTNRARPSLTMQKEAAVVSSNITRGKPNLRHTMGTASLH